MTRLHYLCALLSAAFLLSVALAPALAQAQEETRQATPTSQRPPESPSYYLRHSARPIPRSTREQMPAPLLEKIRQERSRRTESDRRRSAGDLRPSEMANSPEAKLQDSSANLVMRAGAGLTGVRGGATSIADIDNDSARDLIIAGRDASGNPTTTLYLGDGQGGFSEADAGLTGIQFGSISTADVNGDGNQDLLITGDAGDFDPEDPDLGDLVPTATLYLGDGQGGFTEAGAGLTGAVGGSSSIADVDGDGNQDLLITGGDGTTLYLGDGQGGFTEASADLTGVASGSSSIADVDGDGNQDLLITGRDSSENPTATLYLGDGQGGFTEAGAGLTGVANSSSSIADVDGDGNQDLLITGNAATFSSPDPTATLYLGNGQGGFSEADASLAGTEDGSTSIADVDGDGNQDLLITGGEETTATLYLGDGQGSFSEAGAGLAPVFSPSIVSSTSTSIADLQGDGDPDLLITGLGELFTEPPVVEPSARVYINRQVQSPPNRAPTFVRTFSYDRPLAPGVTLQRFVEVGDLDGDSLSIEPASGASNISVDDRGNGTAEVTFTPTRDQGGDVVDVSVKASDPDGATELFSTPVEVSPSVAVLPTSLAGVLSSSSSIADVDGDGNQDLLIVGFDGSDRTATLYLGDGQGGFDEANAGLEGDDIGPISIADVDGDGNQDLLTTGTLYLGNGQGGFTAAGADLTSVGGGSTSIADVDGDGNQDLLITGRDSNENPTATLYLGDGQGGFTEAGAGLTGVANSSSSIADVDGDGNQDLLIAGNARTLSNPDPTATLYLGDGQGGFTEADAGLTGVGGGTISGTLGSSASGSTASIGDVDGDGNPDLLITGLDANDNRTATLYLNDGRGGFTEANAGLTGVRNGSTSIADIDGDGNQDLLIVGEAGPIDPTATLYLGDGQGGLEAGPGLTGVFEGSASIGDIDGDGDPDLLVTGFSLTSLSASTTLYENLFDNPLPVEMAGFKAIADGETVRLSWTTASETGNAGFRVQRRVGETTSGGETASGGNGTWEQIGQVEGSGTTTEATSYRFTDANLPYEADWLEYRLKQVDTDGSASYTDPVAVERSVDEMELLGTYPNPARSQATVRYALPEKQKASIRLYDMLGRQVRTVLNGTREGRYKQRVDMSGLPSGTYFLRLRSDGQTRTQKLTVVR